MDGTPAAGLQGFCVGYGLRPSELRSQTGINIGSAISRTRTMMRS
jgi:hypothetical protein